MDGWLVVFGSESHPTYSNWGLFPVLLLLVCMAWTEEGFFLDLCSRIAGVICYVCIFLGFVMLCFLGVEGWVVWLVFCCDSVGWVVVGGLGGDKGDNAEYHF